MDSDPRLALADTTATQAEDMKHCDCLAHTGQTPNAGIADPMAAPRHTSEHQYENTSLPLKPDGEPLGTPLEAGQPQTQSRAEPPDVVPAGSSEEHQNTKGETNIPHNTTTHNTDPAHTPGDHHQEVLSDEATHVNQELDTQPY